MTAADWSSEADQATTFIERFRGVRGGPPRASLLLETRSVHTIGLGRPIGVVVIDRGFRVVETKTLARNRILYRLGRQIHARAPRGIGSPALAFEDGDHRCLRRAGSSSAPLRSAISAMSRPAGGGPAGRRRDLCRGHPAHPRAARTSRRRHHDEVLVRGQRGRAYQRAAPGPGRLGNRWPW